MRIVSSSFQTNKIRKERDIFFGMELFQRERERGKTLVRFFYPVNGIISWNVIIRQNTKIGITGRPRSGMYKIIEETNFKRQAVSATKRAYKPFAKIASVIRVYSQNSFIEDILRKFSPRNLGAEIYTPIKLIQG